MGNPNWVKGKSGNPSGKSPQIETVQELARSFCGDMVRILNRIARDKKQPAASRVAAAAHVLDRGLGKTPSFSTSDINDFKRATDMSDEELIRIAVRGGIEVEASRETKSPADYPGVTQPSIENSSNKQYQ